MAERYAELLSDEERVFLDAFDTLAWPSQALLVRMIMRKGCHFRLSKLVYPEIGDCLTAAGPLLEQGWVTEQALLTVDEIAELLRKDEVLTHLPLTDRRATQKKAELLEQLRSTELPQSFCRQRSQLALFVVRCRVGAATVPAGPGGCQ